MVWFISGWCHLDVECWYWCWISIDFYGCVFFNVAVQFGFLQELEKVEWFHCKTGTLDQKEGHLLKYFNIRHANFKIQQTDKMTWYTHYSK